MGVIAKGFPGVARVHSPPCPWDTHYQFSIKTLLSNASIRLGLKHVFLFPSQICHLSRKCEAGRPFGLRPTHTSTLGVRQTEGLSVLPHSRCVQPAFRCGTCRFMHFSTNFSDSELRAKACWLKLI